MAAIEQSRRRVEMRPERQLICARCHQLKAQNRLLEQSPQSSSPAGKAKAGEPVNLSDVVASFDREKIMKNIFQQIYSKSIIIYVLDIVNFYGSQIQEVYDLINSGKHSVIVVVNKIDALPKGFKTDRLQLWVKRQLEEKIGKDINWHICLTSAKVDTGMLKVLEILEKWRKQMASRQYRPKIYVLGSTNSGKSSFLNSLLFKSSKYKQKNKTHFKQKYNVLTHSPAPGTTLDLTTVEEFNLGFRVIDTPGIPNLK